MNKQKFAFNKTNFILLAVGMLIVIIGFALMAGPSSTESMFEPDIFSARRIKVAPAVCLGRQAARPHTQERKIPIQQIKQHRAHRDTADKRSMAQMAGYGRIGHSDKRNGYIGQDARKRQFQYPAVHSLDRHIVSLRI